jgi:hypothetical protein
MAAGDDDEAGEESNGVEFVTYERVKVAAMLASLSSSHGGSSEFGREANSGGDFDQLIGGNEEERKGVTSVWLVGGEVAGVWLTMSGGVRWVFDDVELSPWYTKWHEISS